MTRRYTGFDEQGTGEHPALRELRQQMTSRFPRLTNLGTFVVRNMRGKSSPSVHSTGRAWDCGWSGDHKTIARPAIRFLVQNADQIGVELILDYFSKPYGRGWRCDREAWQRYEQPTITGAPNGRWFHVEIAPDATIERVKAAFRSSVV